MEGWLVVCQWSVVSGQSSGVNVLSALTRTSAFELLPLPQLATHN